MPIPTDYIFTPGTCAKKDFYGVIVGALVAAGWTNVASLASTDYEVYTSNGNTGDKALVLNLRKGSLATPANDISTTNFCQMSYRMVTSYTPGAAGVAGTFVRPDSWRDMFIYPIALAGVLANDTVYNYKIYVDKSKVIFSLEFPPALNMLPMVTYLGAPDTQYCLEPGNRGILFASTANNTAAAANVLIADAPGGLGTLTTPEALPMICTLAPKNPNNAGKYTVSDIYYGSTTEGVRGKLDGVVAMPVANVLTGDNITIGSYTYYVLNCATLGVNGFPSLALAVRIA